VTSERERMLGGELYLASDPELVAARTRARRLWQRYNLTDPEAAPERDRILRELLGRLGAGAVIEPPFYCDYGSQIELGDEVFVNFNCVFLDPAAIRIGSRTMIAPNVQLLSADHPRDPHLRVSGRELARPITIGARVWLGGGAIVCPGVTIGDDSTIGAGSVVVRDIPAGVVAAGNPCRVLRSL
jgi:maltose O-acetyltransferase